VRVAEMRTIRWMSGVTREDGGYVRGSIGVASIVDRTRDNRLRWFGYVGWLRTVMELNVEGRRGGGPKKKWSNAIEYEGCWCVRERCGRSNVK